MMKFAALLASAAMVTALPGSVPLDAMTEKALKQNLPLDIFVHLKDACHLHARAAKAAKWDTALNATKPNKAELRTFVHDVLVDFTAKQQAPIIADATEAKLWSKSFWASNTVYIKMAPPSFVKKMMARADVKQIHGNIEYSVVDNVVGDTQEEKFQVVPNASETARRRTQIFEYGIVLTRGEDAQMAGYDGTGVVVMNVDTGVRWTHEALQGNYRGNLGNGQVEHDYNWIAPGSSGNVPVPADQNGHGTHTMGTIAGQAVSVGIGMAPGARWIAGAGCNPFGSCPTADLLESMQFAGCPTRTDGSDPDCSRAADLVSNSWGGGQGTSTFWDVIGTLNEQNVIVTFSMGNSGSSCGSANSPGDSDMVISVGASDSADLIAGFSSRGPGTNVPGVADQQPFIDGPGVGIISSYPGNDQQYASASGTSMSCPHISGYIAQLMGAYPDITLQDVKRAMEVSSFKQMAPAAECGGVPTTQYPNYVYGYGRIDVCAALSVLGPESC